MQMYIKYNPNPVSTRNVDDCVVRAITKALNIDWETAYALLANNGFLMGDLMNSNLVWGSVLRQYGFKRSSIPNTCPDCYTISDFCKDHKKVFTFWVQEPTLSR
jgi:hypothetical protein